MVKIVACASQYHGQLEKTFGERREWALSSLQPSLRVIKGEEQALEVLRETAKIETLPQGVELLTGQQSGLTMRGGQTGIEIGWA